MITLPDLFRSERNIFDEAFSDFDEMFNRMMLPVTVPRWNAWAGGPRMGVEDVEGGYLLSVEVPGFTKDDIKVDVRENQISISGEIRRESGEEGGAVSQRFNRFQRSFSMPYDLDSSLVQASCDNGILEVFIPKSEEKLSNRVQIGSGERLSARLKGGAARVVTGQAPSTQAKGAQSKTQQKGSEAATPRH
jgi:HSP20 family protein